MHSNQRHREHNGRGKCKENWLFHEKPPVDKTGKRHGGSLGIDNPPAIQYPRGTATMAIPASAARFNKASRSNSSVRPASTERQLAPAWIIVSKVRIPMTGTSNRMSWFGLATFTTVSLRSRVGAPGDGSLSLR